MFHPQQKKTVVVKFAHKLKIIIEISEIFFEINEVVFKSVMRHIIYKPGNSFRFRIQ